MALNNIEKIKNAELEASRKISEAEAQSRENLKNTRQKALEITKKAEEYSKITLEHKADKAKAKAEEIVISAANSAKLQAEALKSEALKKQDQVNNGILEIII